MNKVLRHSSEATCSTLCPSAQLFTAPKLPVVPDVELSEAKTFDSINTDWAKFYPVIIPVHLASLALRLKATEKIKGLGLSNLDR